MDAEPNPGDDDLRTRLHAMETKLRRMRDQRNTHSENARRAADSRNAVQEQGKTLREAINERMESQKEIRNKARVHKARRDEIDRKSTRLNSSHKPISYAVFCLKKKKSENRQNIQN